jgi:hypothetical protein
LMVTPLITQKISALEREQSVQFQST